MKICHWKVSCRHKSWLGKNTCPGTTCEQLARTLCTGTAQNWGSDGCIGHLAVFVQVQLQGLEILLKAQSAHGPEQIVAIDGLALFPLAFVTGSAFRQQAHKLLFSMLHFHTHASKHFDAAASSEKAVVGQSE